MAQRTNIEYVSDLTGKPITDNDSPTVSFALDGKEYEIDLSDKEQEKLRSVLEPFIKAGSKVGRKTGTRGAKTQIGPTAAEIRAWAQQNGFEVPDRGRIPAEVREAFDKAS